MKNLLLLVMLIAPAILTAKGDLVKITISGVGLATPIETTSPEIGLFNIFAGPGVRVNKVEQTEGFIIDWSKGKAAQRQGEHYEVTFWEGCRTISEYCHTTEQSIVYKVFYDKEGYVYLPGKDDEAFRYNHAMWHGHNLEGNWFQATTAWKNFVTPLITK
jgi:hypothetical protein